MHNLAEGLEHIMEALDAELLASCMFEGRLDELQTVASLHSVNFSLSSIASFPFHPG